MPMDRKKAADYAKGAAMSPLMKAPAMMPLRAALIGAAAGLDAPETGDVADVGVVGKAAPLASHTASTAGEVLSSDVDMAQAERLAFGAGIEDAKEAARKARASHAAGAAANAREDPASGTRQGASQRYPGTGTVDSRTAETGGVTTGEPGHLRMEVGGEMMDYTPGDPRFEGAVDPGDFMEHRQRTMEPSESFYRAGPKSPAGHGGSLWTESSVPEAAQVRSRNQLALGVEAESQQFLTDMAEAEAAQAAAEAKEARAGALAEEPFLAETIQARSQIGEANIEAASREAERSEIKAIVSEAAARANALRQDPRFLALPPERQKEIEDQIWDEARLALSALTETNLYPRPDPYAWMSGLGAPPAEEKAKKE